MGITAKYTLTQKGFSDLESTFGREIQEEIDWQVIVSVYKSQGWYFVRSKYSKYTPDECFEILTWAKQHLSDNQYSHRGAEWIFKNEKEALLFSLTWS